MIEILESPKHLVALRIEGTITADDIEKAYKKTEDALSTNERVSFFAETGETLNFTFEGLLKDLWNGLGQLGKLSKYYRAAVVTDIGWIATMARVEGLVFSNIDVRVFEPSDHSKAFAWASEKPEPLPEPVEPPPSVRLIQSTSDQVLAFEVDGRLRQGDVKTLVDAMNPLLEKDGKFDLLVRIKSLGGFDLFSFLNDELIKVKLRSYSRIRKVAVVGPAPWLRNLIELGWGLLPKDVTVFDHHEEAAAWEWLGAQQALLAGK